MVPTPAGGVAARGVVKRSGKSYTATVTEGALQNWRLQVDGRSSPVLAEGSRLAWEAA